MAAKVHFKFDPDQKHQLDAIESVLGLFRGLPKTIAAFALGDEVVGNLPPFEALNESWLEDNLRQVQSANKIQAPILEPLAVEDGMLLDGVSNDNHRYPSFTIEMETGTGKTYVYLRTIYELRLNFGFSKFVIVVPSIAIYEGVIKNFEVTRSHLRALYGNEVVNPLPYDGSRVSQLRGFASSSFVEVMVITLDAFNKSTNTIYKASEKLPGERLPYQYIQETRPILILDEPQNMESDKSKEAIRTLKPLFALRYSATHRTSPNLIYRLTPFEAYRLNLVKKIQVFGITERENANRLFLALETAERVGGRIQARFKTHVLERGARREAEVILKQGDNLYEKTRLDEHRAGYRVTEINLAQQFVEFENGLQIRQADASEAARSDLFRVQIRTTIEQHMQMQQKLQRQGIKVLSLFFIDRVDNYVAEHGIIRTIFDEEFERLKYLYPYFAQWSAGQVREAYFAKRKTKTGEEEAFDTEGRNQEQREAEKVAFELIMRKKEQLLLFTEPVCFIFAHSALKEGWDNPNVFQICTLNQTRSEVKKRQEIGRGLRLAVNQELERVSDDEVNILSVIANESYKSYADGLQSEYRETGDAAPPPPRDGSRRPALRNDAIFAAQAFRDFWAKLQRRTRYAINVDTPALVERCIERINNQPTPQAVIVVEKALFVVTEFRLKLESVTGSRCRIQVTKQDTESQELVYTHTFTEKADLAVLLREDLLRGFKITRITDKGVQSEVTFSNGEVLKMQKELIFQSEQGQRATERATAAPQETYPVFNLIDRAAKETGLTRPTINAVFKGLTDRKKESIFRNPEGFAGMFITEINNALADHVAERIEFVVDDNIPQSGYNLDELFPPQKAFPQKELVDSGSHGLYDQTQVDSEVEQHFVTNRLIADDQVLYFFKFPPAFKIHLPKVLGNYNPDWGIARYSADGSMVLQLVRETKGGPDLSRLQFPSEKRKIISAMKHFKAVGIDYKMVDDRMADWWTPAGEGQSRFEV